MALSSDDRLLGEKMDYYCSSSEDEAVGAESGDEEGSGNPGPQESSAPVPDITTHKGLSTNTGPKGVVSDWRRYKQLENEKREEAEREKLELIKKLSITCQSQLDEDREAATQQRQIDESAGRESDGEEEDEFLREYRLKRLAEMRHAFDATTRFGSVRQVTHDEFVTEVDKEKATVTVVVHLFDKNAPGCIAMQRCLACLAREYPVVKFLQLEAHAAKLSHKFLSTALPALLVYRAGHVVGNFVRMRDEFGDEFFASDVESFLVENGCLPDKALVPAAVVPGGGGGGSVRESEQQQQDSDSDLELD